MRSSLDGLIVVAGLRVGQKRVLSAGVTLPVVGNTVMLSNSLVFEATQLLRTRLPGGWSAAALSPPPRTATSEPRCHAVLMIRCCRRREGKLLMVVRNRLEPRDVDYLAAIVLPTSDEPVLVAAPFLSPRSQQRLRERGFAYADLTGNVRVALSRPGLFIETTGARANPEPSPRDRRSLKGAKAGRLVRTLCDFRPPIGLRELAGRAGVDPGYASRVVDLLLREALVTRATRGPITNVDWPALLRRWSDEYSPLGRRRAAMYLAPRGIEHVLDRLRTTTAPYAVTGSWVATQVAPITATHLLMVYVDTPSTVDEALGLRFTGIGGNVALLTPFDTVVFERTSTHRGISTAALSQVAADLLNSPGRGPNEGEALIEWMRENERVWRE
jgi:hypothetical protein